MSGAGGGLSGAGGGQGLRPGRVAATILGAHIAVNNKDRNWAYAQFLSERGREGEYFPIGARQLTAGESVTLGIARGPFWSRIEWVRGPGWTGSANFS
ncbi:MAG: hypothetical protein J0I12_30460 [Candidatus Eremiobacteraeota bacterium]|nr:hypothetical protein [Candidatus Eremiobacteraeota bacterium]